MWFGLKDGQHNIRHVLGSYCRICLVSLAMDKCILSSNLLKADYEGSSKIHSSKAHSKNRKNSDQILDFMALPCSQCWAFKSIREKKVLELEDPR